MPAGLAADREAVLEPPDAEAGGQGHSQVHEGRHGIDLDGPVGALADLVGLEQQIGIGDRGDQRGRLEQLDHPLEEGRNHALHGLRQDDPAHQLRMAHADRPTSLPLALLDRDDAAAEHLGEECGGLDRKGQDRGLVGVDPDADEDRQGKEDPEQLDQRRRGAEEVDHDAGRDRDQAAAREPQQGHQEPERNPEGERDAGHLERVGEPEEQPVELAEDDGEIPLIAHDPPRPGEAGVTAATSP